MIEFPFLEIEKKIFFHFIICVEGQRKVREEKEGKKEKERGREEAGEMAQRLRALTALPEVLSSLPRMSECMCQQTSEESIRYPEIEVTGNCQPLYGS